MSAWTSLTDDQLSAAIQEARDLSDEQLEDLDAEVTRRGIVGVATIECLKAWRACIRYERRIPVQLPIDGVGP